VISFRLVNDAYEYCRYFTLSESTLIYDNTVEGHATGLLYYNVPAAVTTGQIATVFNVVDGNYNTIAASNITEVVWYSDDVWTSNGNIIALSLFEVLDGNSLITSWDATGAFMYGNDNYTIYAVENPIDASKSEIYSNLTKSVSSIMTTESGNIDIFRGVFQNLPSMPSVPIFGRSLTTVDDDSLYNFDDYFLLIATGKFGGNWYSW
jgi:hypothetical protein